MYRQVENTGLSNMCRLNKLIRGLEIIDMMLMAWPEDGIFMYNKLKYYHIGHAVT